MSYYHGRHKVVCDQCGFEKLNTQCRLQWDNLFVCSSCYDPRHPQLDIEVRQERIPTMLRPEGTDEYLVTASEWGALTDVNGTVLYDSEGEPVMPYSNEYGGS